MRHLKSILAVSILLISACGGGGGESSNSVAQTVDGFLQPLSDSDDSFIDTASNNNKLSSISALKNQRFTASKKLNISLIFNEGQPCAINIYKDYVVGESEEIITRDQSRIMKLTSDNCQYNGPLAVLNQQSKVLIEIIDINNNQINYSEAMINGDTLSFSAI